MVGRAPERHSKLYTAKNKMVSENKLSGIKMHPQTKIKDAWKLEN